MFKSRLITAAVAALIAGGAYAQSNTFATGNMHFDVKDMDTDGDHMVSRDEMMKYNDKMWEMMANGKETIPVAVAAKDFASGGVKYNAREIDADHDGSISKAEFEAYSAKKFDKMKNADGQVSVADMAKAFARGHT
jgi:uncharacterized membrane protein YvbJ